MDTSTINTALQNYQKHTTDSPVKTLANGEKEVYGVKLATQTTKIEQQASIVTHFFSNKETIDSDSLKLAYQTAIAKINELMNPEEDNPAITQEKLDEQGIEYWSAENTAKRIIEGASGFLAGFQKAHPELEGEELLDKFNEVVGGGLKQGFNEAKGLLGDLNVFSDKIADNFNKTVSLVEQGMIGFKTSQLVVKTDSKDNQKDKQAEIA